MPATSVAGDETVEPTQAGPADAKSPAQARTPEATQQTFADLGVDPLITDALAEVGIVHPFPIQAMAIPIALKGTDMIGQARTGTGKTLAFGSVLLQRLLADPEGANEPHHPRALVVAPTRELAGQVSKDLTRAAAKLPSKIMTVYGGVSYEPQLEALERGRDVVVGTPGRLLDLVQRKVLRLNRVRVAVLDEADEMLDLGFLPDIERLLAQTPTSRQTLLFSATMPSAIVSLARQHLNQPVNIRAESDSEKTTVPATTQFVYQAHDLDKPEMVARILQATDVDKVMIFCRTKRSAQRLSDDLVDRGFPAAPLHGDLGQGAREQALKKFREGSVTALVATDVASRGIDVTGVSHVINYECPDDDATYVHRIGRTGRAGASGVAVTLVDWSDLTRWKVINKTLGLELPEPPETYSSSEHFYADLGIPTGTRGSVPRKHRIEHERKAKSSENGDAPRKRRRRRRRSGGPGGGSGAASQG
ncbi:RNA helicase [Parenemella sanctibonifatiensis]|uniref:RNA helicase n=1 Tax=Parenemella sanctibonifatiensis TaxID=2016505 RepID=A0A255EIU4_9ACTN|nr:RNA helicase [Parenemella sanctibonifatiensis]